MLGRREGDDMELRVLGPLEVVGPRGPVDIPGGRQRAILALLAVNAGRLVSTDRLIAEIWILPRGVVGIER